jgi:hypothetical protein
MANTIVADNTAGGGSGNCSIAGIDEYGIGGTLGENRNNLIQDGTCDPAFRGDPLLAPLADNGGDTLTHALLLDSPAVDSIAMTDCTLPDDQRGAPRPVAQTSPDTPCDIGAFELQND